MSHWNIFHDTDTMSLCTYTNPVWHSKQPNDKVWS